MAALTRDDFDGKLLGVWDSLADEPTRSALAEHLLGGTSADRLSGLLSDSGHPVGATTIRNWRRDRREVTT